jgi:hypothetical protein
VAALLLTACGRGGEASLSRSAGSTRPLSLVGPSTTTTVPPPVAQAPTATSTTVSSRSSAGRDQAAEPAPPAPGPGAPVAAKPIRPASAGTYRFDTTGETAYPGLGGGTSPYPAVTTLVVDPPSGTHQHATRNLRDASGNGPVIETRFDYRPDGVYLDSLQLTVSVLLFSDTEEFRPQFPTLLLPTGARPGYSHDLSLPGQAGPAHLVIDVLDDEQTGVGGEAVDTTVVRLTASSSGQFNARMELTLWVAPSAGIWVKERSSSEASAPEGQPLYRGQDEATLQRLTPG